MAKETKLPKVSFPRTSDGFQKRIEKMQKEGINTRDRAYEYVMLNLKSIEHEMESCRAFKENPMIAGLLERYEALKEKWEKRLQFTIDHINDPIGETGKA